MEINETKKAELDRIQNLASAIVKRVCEEPLKQDEVL
jgi:hypothetical protein